ncbi:hypothetical protein [Spirochaeta isovalerica]|uniref:ABC-2 family transporter protein n=1 Tax=Spirochaeta isovalerica TaxID=150 RepID=A0A841RA65_9SPIO|nr:hypothetical protein [Spirochaeta isovalerica]MBB6479819.1 hypothetical protein [Spirochaeta isovalerica]
MNRLLILEFKRVLKRRQTMIIIFVSFFFSIVLAMIPVISQEAFHYDKSGKAETLKGLDAIVFKRDLQKDIIGIVTPEKFRLAVEISQKCLREYGVESQYDLPVEVYTERIEPYSLLVHKVKEVLADPDTGFAPSILQIDPETLDGNFYDRFEERLEGIMETEQKDHRVVRSTSIEMYKRVQLPLFFFGTNGDAMDYQVLLSFIILLACTFLAAPVFSSDYQNGAEDILRCTKYGGIRLANVRIITSICVSALLYGVSISLYIFISNSLFGWECTETSMQVVYSAVSLPDWNIGQLQWIMMFAGLASVMATVSFTLLISSKNRNVLIPLAIGLITCILPMIIYFPLRKINEDLGLWVQAIVASNGAGLLGSFYYEALDLYFLRIGRFAIWVPLAMVVFSVAEFGFFIAVSNVSYDKYKEY